MTADVLQCPQVELLKSGTFSISFSSPISNIMLTISKQDGKIINSAIVEGYNLCFLTVFVYTEKTQIFSYENGMFYDEGSVSFTWNNFF